MGRCVVVHAAGVWVGLGLPAAGYRGAELLVVVLLLTAAVSAAALSLTYQQHPKTQGAVPVSESVETVSVPTCCVEHSL